MKKNKVKYKVIAYEQLNNSNRNDIGFIAPDGTFYYLRKYKKGDGQHTLIADILLKSFNDPCDDINMSCEKICQKYGFLFVLDDYGDGKVSIRYYHEPTQQQWNVINKLYVDYAIFKLNNNR